jgi:hypothetical protein
LTLIAAVVVSVLVADEPDEPLVPRLVGALIVIYENVTLIVNATESFAASPMDVKSPYTSILPPVGGDPAPAASNAPISVMVLAPAAVSVPVNTILSFVTVVVPCATDAETRASVVLVVVTTLADAAAAEPVPHWSHQLAAAKSDVIRASPLFCTLAVT